MRISFLGGGTNISKKVAENQSAINLSSLSSPEEIMPDLLRGLCGDASKRDILACIPSRTELDTLVGIYFESLEASIRLSITSIVEKGCANIV